MKKPRRRRCIICGELHHAENMGCYDGCKSCLKIVGRVEKDYPHLDYAATVEIARAVQRKGTMIEVSKTIH